MSWFHSSTAAVVARNYASPVEIVACFQEQRNVLTRLALLITGDQATADQAVVHACETTLQGNSPFRDWLFEWAKAATIASATSHRTQAIRVCEAAYKDRRCPHVEHLSQGDAEERAVSLDLILGTDANTLIAELDPLCRAVLVLRVAIRSSIQDCALRLNVSRAAVLGANCHAMTWLQDGHAKHTALRTLCKKRGHQSEIEACILVFLEREARFRSGQANFSEDLMIIDSTNDDIRLLHTILLEQAGNSLP
jgi:DNA-directed RNA polymerase specialized sigma24 family protein